MASPDFPTLVLPAWVPADLQEILQTLLEQLNWLVESDMGAVLIAMEAGLQVAASLGFPAAFELNPAAGWSSADPQLGQLTGGLQPVVSERGLADTPLSAWAATVSAGACLQVPLAYHGRPVGLLILLKTEPGHYDARDAQTAMAFANQAALAIENARLYAETRRRAAQLEAAGQVSQRVISILALDQLLAEVVRLIGSQLGYDHVQLFLVEGEPPALVLRASSGSAAAAPRPQQLRLPIDAQSLSGWVAANGQPVLCNDVSQEPRYQPHALLPHTRAELAVPLRVGDVIVGVLDVQSEQRNCFHPDDRLTLQILADQVASAVENAHLFERTRRQMTALQALQHISLEIAAQSDPSAGLAAILEQAARLLEAQASSLGILDPEARIVRLRAIYNLPPEYAGVGLPLGEGAAGRVVATGTPVIVNDYTHWAERSPAFQPPVYDAVMSVPLRQQGQVIGALTVTDHKERRPFQAEDAQLLSWFASLAGLALRHAELNGQIRQAQAALEHKVDERTQELERARRELARQAAELRDLLRLTVRVQEEERARIAQDLHDGSNQLITGALYELQAARQSLVNGRPEAALPILESAKQLLRNIDAENRRLISGLRPPILDAQGLLPALHWQAANFQAVYGLPCTVRVLGQPGRLSAAAETALYRIVQEALHNVAAHAQAGQVKIGVHAGPQRLQLTVEDDGVGFDYPETAAARPGRMGLIGMRERAASLGGQLTIDSAPGRGTRLTLTLADP